MSKKQQIPKTNDRKDLNAKSGKKQVKGIGNKNILQTLKLEIDFLNMFNQTEINFLFENYDIIVFERGMILAKQNQTVDFIGVILNGGAIAQKSKTKYSKNSFLGNGVSFFGLENHKHPQTIIAESEGIIFSIRIEILLAPSKNELQNLIKSKIIKFMVQETLFYLKEERQFKSSAYQEFEILDEKNSQKFQQSNKLYSSLMDAVGEQKDKQRFIEQFPLFCAKQKTMIVSKHTKPFFLLLLKGQLVIKYGLGLKKQSRNLQANSLYNCEGFIFDHNQFSNVYCSSSEAVFLIVDKERLINNFKLMTVSGILKYLLEYTQKTNGYSLRNLVPQSQDSMINQNTQIWTPFKKAYQIQQIPTKTSSKLQSNKSNTTRKKDSINVFQTLYQTFSTNSKNKLKSNEIQFTQSFDAGIKKSKISTVMKTQYSTDQKSQANNTSQKIKKLQSELQTLKSQNISLLEQIKKLKLDLLESQSRLKMSNVFREITKLKGKKQVESLSQQSTKIQNKSVTLKQAFSSHLKNKKLQLLVVKCAYKWLSLTRQNKSKRANQSSGSLLSKSALGILS